jgi:uncharacterized protein YigE (DUF2233 family)
MKLNRKILSFIIVSIGLIGIFAFVQIKNENDSIVISHIVDLKEQDLKFYWKNENGVNFKNFQNLKNWLKTNSEELVFAMNGGMYKKDLSPQGLFIENGIKKSNIDTLKNGYGNFYMQPNGIFFIINDNEGIICETKNFKFDNVKYATQSGPLLLIEGRIHPKFRKGSKNLNIRNGVGILPNGNLLFAMSIEKINFYDFANYFKSLGCKNALYLDGFVSKTYLPEKELNRTEGDFGVIIGETERKE